MTLLLKNAHIVDGSGGEPFRGDILINGSTISAIGNLQHKKTDEAIDCQGAYVAPGFIDAHSTTDHYGSILRHPEQDHYLEQGITSVIGGYDGVSLAPFTRSSNKQFHRFHSGRSMNVDWTYFKEFLSTLKRIRPGVNFGSFVGYAHGLPLIEQSLREGAFGVSMNSTPISKAAEKALDAVLMHYRTILSVPHAPESSQEIKRFSKLSDAGVKILFHAIVPLFATEREYEAILKATAEYETRGFTFAIPASEFVTMPISALLPEWLHMLERDVVLDKLSDAWLRKKITAEIQTVDPQQLRVVHAPQVSSVVGITLKDFMTQHGIRDSKEALVALIRATELRAGVRISHIPQAYVDQLMKQPNALFGSFEPGAYRTDWHSYDVSHGFLDLLCAAEQKGATSIAALVAQITMRPAMFFGIPNRGFIKEGVSADLVGFKNKELKFAIVNGLQHRGGHPLSRTTSHTAP